MEAGPLFGGRPQTGLVGSAADLKYQAGGSAGWMKHEVGEGCSQLQVPGPGQERMSAISAKPAWCPVPTGARNGWPKCAPPPGLIRQSRGWPLSPLSLQGGARTTGGVRFCGGQTETTLRGGEDSPPHFPEIRHSWKSQHFNAGCTPGPTAHRTGTPKPRPAPSFLRENHTGHTALAPAHSGSGLRTGLGLTPTGSLPCWQHEETKTQRLRH